MKTAVITLSDLGAGVASAIAEKMDCDLFVHEAVEALPEATRFKRVIDLTEEIFKHYQGLVYIMPTGVVVRAIAPHVSSKLHDPAVVVLDVHGRWVISMLSGHEGGANALSTRVGNILDAEPIITTTTEAEKLLVVGIGCRRGKTADEIKAAIAQGLAMINRKLTEVRILATADVKRDEEGIIQAAKELDLTLRVISSESIRSCCHPVTESEFVKQQVNVPAVAEPAALLAGRRTSLLLQKTAFNGITIAIAEESSSSLA